MKVLHRLLDGLDVVADLVAQAAKWLMLVLTTGIFAIVMVTVVTRYGFNYVISWSEEVPRYLLVWIAMLGSGLAVDRKEHIGFDYVYNRLPVSLRRPLGFLLNIGVGAVGAIMLVYGIDFVQQFGGDYMESIPFTNIWFYPALPVAGGMILLFIVRQELNLLTGRTPPDEPVL